MRGRKRTSLAKRQQLTWKSLLYLYRRKVDIHSSILYTISDKTVYVTNVCDDYEPHDATRGFRECATRLSFSTSPRIEIASLRVKSRAPVQIQRYRREKEQLIFSLVLERQSLAAIGKYGLRYLQRPVFN